MSAQPAQRPPVVGKVEGRIETVVKLLGLAIEQVERRQQRLTGVVAARGLAGRRVTGVQHFQTSIHNRLRRRHVETKDGGAGIDKPAVEGPTVHESHVEGQRGPLDRLVVGQILLRFCRRRLVVVDRFRVEPEAASDEQADARQEPARVRKSSHGNLPREQRKEGENCGPTTYGIGSTESRTVEVEGCGSGFWRGRFCWSAAVSAPLALGLSFLGTGKANFLAGFRSNPSCLSDTQFLRPIRELSPFLAVSAP